MRSKRLSESGEHCQKTGDIVREAATLLGKQQNAVRESATLSGGGEVVNKGVETPLRHQDSHGSGNVVMDATTSS